MDRRGIFPRYIKDSEEMMNRHQQGFSLTELMVSMVMFIMVITAATQFFSAQFDQFKRQSRIAEGSIEGLIGLEMMRIDISHAGFGLPWLLNGAQYQEAQAESGETPWVDRDFNDAPPNNPARGSDLGAPAVNPPGAIRSGSWSTLGNGTTLNRSDVLVLKATNLAQNLPSQKWTRLGAGDDKRNGLSGDEFDGTDQVIVLSPSDRILEIGGGRWFTSYNNTSDFEGSGDRIRLIYGIKSLGVEPRFPFNRVDYYLKRPSDNMPTGCAEGGTGILYRSLLSHDPARAMSAQHDERPVMDCVADFQVVYRLRNGNLADESYTFLKTAKEIRDDVKGVTVYILAHEGQKDPAFNYEDATNGHTILVGPDQAVGHLFDFTASNIVDWRNYRWRLYTVPVTLYNLGA